MKGFQKNIKRTSKTTHILIQRLFQICQSLGLKLIGLVVGNRYWKFLV